MKIRLLIQLVLWQIRKKGEIDNVGGAYYITGLSSDAPTSENIEYYAKLVQEKFILEKLLRQVEICRLYMLTNQKKKFPQF